MIATFFYFPAIACSPNDSVVCAKSSNGSVTGSWATGVEAEAARKKVANGLDSEARQKARNERLKMQDELRRPQQSQLFIHQQQQLQSIQRALRK